MSDFTGSVHPMGQRFSLFHFTDDQTEVYDDTLAFTKGILGDLCIEAIDLGDVMTSSDGCQRGDFLVVVNIKEVQLTQYFQRVKTAELVVGCSDGAQHMVLGKGGEFADIVTAEVQTNQCCQFGKG